MAKPNGPFSGRYVFITIHKGNSKEDQTPVQLGVEGRVLQIKRGEKVSIPFEHFECLASRTAPNANDSGEVVGDYPRFSFTFHGEDNTRDTPKKTLTVPNKDQSQQASLTA